VPLVQPQDESFDPKSTKSRGIRKLIGSKRISHERPIEPDSTRSPIDQDFYD